MRFFVECYRECVHNGHLNRLLRVSHIINHLDPIPRHAVFHIAANCISDAETAAQASHAHAVLQLDDVLRFQQLRDTLRFVNMTNFNLPNMYKALGTWNWAPLLNKQYANNNSAYRYVMDVSVDSEMQAHYPELCYSHCTC